MGDKRTMTRRRIKTKKGAEPCPTCGNSTEFVIHSEQVAEDCCEVYAVCTCGHATPPLDRYEDVMGGTDDSACIMALRCWNDSVRSGKTAERDRPLWNWTPKRVIGIEAATTKIVDNIFGRGYPASIETNGGTG